MDSGTAGAKFARTTTMPAIAENVPRTALVGVTGYGAVHFLHLNKLADEGECALVSAAVVNPESPAAAEPLEWLRAHGAAVYPTAEALFEAERGRLDLVCLPVGIAAHEPLVKAALGAGANVLVEKPATGCVAAVDRMVEAERAAAPRRVFVGFQHVSAPEVGEIRRVIASGALGAPRKIVVTGIWPRNDGYYARNSWAGRLAAPDGAPVRDSPANNAFAHYLNLALLFASCDPTAPAEPVNVEGALFRARPEIETFDTCMVRFHTAGNAEILLCLTHTGEKVENPRIRVECERGSVVWRLDGPWEIRGGGDAPHEPLASGLAASPVETMFRAVCRAVRGEPCSAGLCSLAMARAQVAAVELLHAKLSITPVLRSAVRRADGQWIVPGLPEVFGRVWQTGQLELPDWT